VKIAMQESGETVGWVLSKQTKFTNPASLERTLEGVPIGLVAHKSNTWTTLFVLFPDLASVIEPEEINQGRNLMIMAFNQEFGGLGLALEPMVSV
jgi:hypothetical protein